MVRRRPAAPEEGEQDDLEPKNGLNDEDVDVPTTRTRSTAKDENKHHSDGEDTKKPLGQAWAGVRGVELTQGVPDRQDGCPCRPPNQESGRWRSWPLVNLLMASAAANARGRRKQFDDTSKICRAKLDNNGRPLEFLAKSTNNRTLFWTFMYT